MRFDLIVRLPGVGLATRSFDGPDRERAIAVARAQGLEVLGSVGAGRSGPRVRAGAVDDGVFAEDLAALLQAGLGMLEAVETLGEEAGGGGVTQALAQRLREGHTLSQAMAEAAAFPAVLVASVRASERTGHLVEALQRHAQYARSLRELRASLGAAATYPLVLLAVGAGVVMFLLGYVVPRFAVLIESSSATLPWSSRLLLAAGRALAAQPWLPLLLLAAAAVLALWGWRRLRDGRALQGLQRLPWVGSLLRAYRLAQAWRTAGLLVRGGVPAAQALEQCATLLIGGDREALRRAVQRVREGQALSRALPEAGLADATTTRMLVVAERSGTLAEVLERVAALQDARLQRAVRTTSRLAEPVLMLGIGLVIGTIVVLMYLPIFDLASQLQ